MIIDFKNFNINTLEPENDFEKEVKNFLLEWFSTSEIVEVSTSGSTGPPKILKIDKEKMRSSARMTCNFFFLKEGDTALLCLPIDYISGKMMMVRAIERKLKIKIVKPSLNPLNDIDGQIDFCAMTPLQVENSLTDIHKIKDLIIGGAQISDNLKLKIFKNLDIQNSQCHIFETYGMSETLSHIALKQIFPQPDHFFSVLDDIVISTDKRSCLKIDAPKLNSEILQTNDVVELLNDNQFKFLGRADFVINSGGIKIFPEKIENFLKLELARFGYENELICIGKEDDVLGKKLVLIIEGSRNENLINKIVQIQFEKKYHKPKEILFFDKFPRSANGKILRKDVKENI